MRYGIKQKELTTLFSNKVCKLRSDLKSCSQTYSAK